MGYYSDLTIEDNDPFEEMDEPFEEESSAVMPAPERKVRQAAVAQETAEVSARHNAPVLLHPEGSAVQGSHQDGQKAVPIAEASAATEADSSKASEDEDARKQAHEEAEAKRKAEWEAKQAAKKAAEAEKLARVASMSDEDVMTAAMQQLGEDAEKLTRRNMKECVTEYIQTMCLDDPAFARKVMHPKKSFVHCIWHINNKAAEFAQEEMKANGFKPERGGFPGSGVNGMYGCDIPDDMVYQWAAEYFNDPNAKEDEDKDEKFMPQPYRGTVTTSRTKAKDKKKEQKKSGPKKQEPKSMQKAEDNGQMDFFAEAS